MAPPTDTRDAPVAASDGSAPPRRRAGGRVVVALVAVVAIAALALLLTRHQATSPEEFAAFSARLDTVSAPAGDVTPYDPLTDGSYASLPEGSWQPTGSGTWTSLGNPQWWVAVHGWQLTATDGQATATCESLLAWLSSSGTTLELSAADEGHDLATCLSVFRSVSRAGAGSAVSNAWVGRGGQTSDGQPRYRTGIVMSTSTRGGEVVIQVIADASVANR